MAAAPMFVELDRCFVPIRKDQEPILELGRLWGRRHAGWLSWSELRQHWRVVLLAEASSGKSEEFQNQAELLKAEGKPAFMLRIEELADQGFEAALAPNDAKAFEQWRSASGDGWFFLDSVDEARLNRKNFEHALKRFARDLDQSLARARIFISCRVSDWDSPNDRPVIERLLPVERPATEEDKDPNHNPVLAPIFDAKKKASHSKPKKELNREELLVVQLVPLSSEQYQALAAAAGVNNATAFLEEISRKGLGVFTERPGDVLDIADYWKAHGRLSSFADMIEHSISHKLKERDQHRPDNNIVSLVKARHGAERLAAALTFGKSFTLRAPSHDPDPSLASGAIDPALVLDDWTDAERGALLRRGIFAPSTYGRIRFHHRSSQEYLTARWLHRLLEANASRSEIWSIVFAERYGVETVVPSLRPAAAWLALWHSDIRDEIIRREPLILLRHGDPGSLPVEAKEQLLATYAAKHIAADISDDGIDHRSLWMFADPRLASAIHTTWHTNTRDDFRMDLLRLIREGAIQSCVDLAREAALTPNPNETLRIVAIQALGACEDYEGLQIASAALMAEPSNVTAHLAPSFAQILYPKYLTTGQLLTLIAESRPARRHTIEGFAYHIDEFYDACPTAEDRVTFVSGLAELCLAPPFASQHHRVSKTHAAIAGHLHAIAKREVTAFAEEDPPSHLIRLLMTVERTERHAPTEDAEPPLSTLVRSKSKLNRALFWADVAEQHRATKPEDWPIRLWHVGGYALTRLWGFDATDLPWLLNDVRGQSEPANRRVALSIVLPILQEQGRLNSELSSLKVLVQPEPLLAADLETYLRPPKEDPETRRFSRMMKERDESQTEQERKAKTSWLDFEKLLRANPRLLSDPAHISSWKTGTFRLMHLTEWLEHYTGEREERASREWRLLADAFGIKVAEAYRDGMKTLWRLTDPERPRRQKNGTISTKWTTVLALAGVNLEAAEDPNWTSRLSDKEATRAAQHGCMLERGYPEWFDALVVSHPLAVPPVLKNAIAAEWSSVDEIRSDFLSRYARAAASILPPIQQILFERIVGPAPASVSKLDRAVRIIRNLDLDDDQTRRVARMARQRFARCAATNRDEHALRYLAILLLVETDRAVNDLVRWIDHAKTTERRARAEKTFAVIFERNDSIVASALGRASVPTLKQLLCIAYYHIRMEDDVFHEGVHSPGVRDNAEQARSGILSVLLERPGAEAFRAIRSLADDPIFAARATRFRELGRGKAERDSELPIWTEAEVTRFETTNTAPVKTGADLLQLTTSILADIQLALTKEDVSSRPLLEKAKDEDEVKNWIVEQLNHRSRGRFHAHREVQIADGRKPDVIVSSTTAPCEVAVEVKHGGRGWTPKSLQKFLRTQLAADYLKPITRRHGIFLITYHGGSTWRDPVTGKPMTFPALVAWLGSIAATLLENECGAIEVRCMGIDASPVSKVTGTKRSAA
jgi:hypothetical protein